QPSLASRHRPPRPPRSPYTTLFRSRHRGADPDGPRRRLPPRRLGVAGCSEFHYNSHMDRAVTASDANRNFSELLRQAEQGEKIAVRKSTRLNSSHVKISYAVFCLKK